MDTTIDIRRDPDNDAVVILHMQDGDGKNVFSDAFVELLSARLRELQSLPECKVVILQGLSDVFCAGASKDALVALCGGDLQVKDLVLSELVMNVPVPTIAAMEGAALGGGFVLALCCDMILLNERRMYGANFTNMGFTPGMGCTGLLQGLVGEYIANEMMFRGRLFKGRSFRGRGLANDVLPENEIMPRALDIAYDIAEKPRKTLEILKYTLSLKKRQLLAEARTHEDLMHQISFAQPEVREMLERMYNG